MKKILLFAAVAAFVGFSSCTKTQVDQPQNDQTISFGTFLGKGKIETKGALSTATTIQTGGFYVLAYEHAGNWNGTPTALTSWAQPANVTYSGGAWGYTPLVAWPQSNLVSFFAYAPAAEANHIVVDQTVTSSAGPSITFMTKTSVNNHQDLLYALHMNASPFAATTNLNSGKVPIKFRHALNAIGFTAKLKSQFPNNSVVNVTGIYVAVAQGKKAAQKYTFATTTSDGTSDSGTWADISGASTFKELEGTSSDKPYTITNNYAILGNLVASEVKLDNTAALTSKNIGEAASNHGYYILLPQAYTGTDFVFRVEYTVTQNSITTTYKYPLSTNVNKVTIGSEQFIPVAFGDATHNKKYLINLVIKDTFIYFEDPTVADWTDGSAIGDITI